MDGCVMEERLGWVCEVMFVLYGRVYKNYLSWYGELFNAERTERTKRTEVAPVSGLGGLLLARLDDLIISCKLAEQLNHTRT